MRYDHWIIAFFGGKGEVGVLVLDRSGDIATTECGLSLVHKVA